MNRSPWIALALTLASASSLPANDSSYGVQNGSFQLERNPHVSLLKETLTLGTDQISVDYVFKNESPNALVLPTVFPMPPMQFSAGDVSRIKNFRIFVDGKPIQPKRHFVALFEGKDITPQLAQLGWNEKKLVALFERCFVNDEPATELMPQFPKGWMSPEGLPRFTLQEYFAWELGFDGLQQRSVQHTYSPSTSNLVPSQPNALLQHRWSVVAWPKERQTPPPTLEKHLRKTDPALLKTLESDPNLQNQVLSGTYLEYKLSTGAHWKGPIEDFTLILRKPSAASLFTAFGHPQLKGMEISQPDAKTVRFHKARFVPREDLRILLLAPKP